MPWGPGAREHVCMHVCLCTYVQGHKYACIHHIHTYMHACTNVHTYIATSIHLYIHSYMHTYIHTYIPTCIHRYIDTYIHACMHACMHAIIHFSADSVASPVLPLDRASIIKRLVQFHSVRS